jgi:hypothetical protein
LIGEPTDVLDLGEALHEASFTIVEDVINELPPEHKLSVMLKMVLESHKREQREKKGKR